MINNPPHMLDKEGKIIPSALIPFCTFDSDIKGKFMTNFSFPVCDLFDPVVYDGKLCYQIDLAKKMPKEKTVQGDGLTLLLDANIEKSVIRLVERNEKINPTGLDLKEVNVETNKFVGINIGTLAPYSAFGPGTYILSAVKQMAATKGFLSMSKKKRECEKEKFEDCQKRLFQESVRKCGCTPQSLVPALQDHTQVQDQKIFV